MVGIGTLLAVVYGAVRFDGYTVRSGSMVETLLPGDILVVDSWAGRGIQGLRFGSAPPRTGEIWVLAPRAEGGDFQVKRLIGLPGDKIAMRDGSVYLNGEKLPEPYARFAPRTEAQALGFEWQRRHLLPGVDSSAYEPSSRDWGPLMVPDSSYFVLGDNRALSIDSRNQGFVRAGRLRGRVKGILFSYGTPEHGAFPVERVIRWDRIGRVEPTPGGRGVCATG